MKLFNSKAFYWGIFPIGILILWVILFETDLINDTGKQIGIFIGSTGLLFSFIQFKIHLINRRNDYLRKICYVEYQRLRKLINDFTNILNEHMMFEPNPGILLNKLMNIRNEISEIMNANNEKIFVGILDTEASKNFNEITEKIFKRTNNYNRDYNKAIKKHKNRNQDIELEQFFLQWNWHKEISESLRDYFYKYKLQLLKELQNYFFN